VFVLKEKGRKNLRVNLRVVRDSGKGGLFIKKTRQEVRKERKVAA